MYEKRELTPEEKIKLKTMLMSIAVVFAGSYLGAKLGVYKAMGKGCLKIHLVTPDGIETVLKQRK